MMQPIKNWRIAVTMSIVGAFFFWEMLPPFAASAVYEGKSYIEMSSLIGEANEFAPEKYIAWKRQRLLSFWFLVASYEGDSNLNNARLFGYRRYFCLGVTQYNVKIPL